MGWWSIDATKEEIEAEENSDNKLYNAIPEESNKNRLYSGDSPADDMQEAVDKIDKEYKRVWGRKAKREELICALEFVMGNRR